MYRILDKHKSVPTRYTIATNTNYEPGTGDEERYQYRKLLIEPRAGDKKDALDTNLGE
jgi:hypothetical protein